MITAEYINDLCTRAHSMAKDKGWWDESRTPYELGNTCHSKLSESLEELRDGRAVTEIYFTDDEPTKPEGFPTELADFVIRLADWASGSNYKCRFTAIEAISTCAIEIQSQDVQCLIYELHEAIQELVKEISGINTRIHASKRGEVTIFLGMGIAFVWAESHGIDLPSIIEQKMAYNATRPIRHGKKF